MLEWSLHHRQVVASVAQAYSLRGELFDDFQVAENLRTASQTRHNEDHNRLQLVSAYAQSPRRDSRPFPEVIHSKRNLKGAALEYVLELANWRLDLFDVLNLFYDSRVRRIAWTFWEWTDTLILVPDRFIQEKLVLNALETEVIGEYLLAVLHLSEFQDWVFQTCTT